MQLSYKFFCNKECEWFPCHSTLNEEEFNCLFCYCPLYPDRNCGGEYAMLDNGWKDCSACLIPHENYQYIIKRLIENHQE